MPALDDYELGERITERRGATSYRGRRHGSRDSVVISIVPSAASEASPTFARCQHEFQVARAVEHESVVRYLDVRAAPEGALLIQEDFGGVMLEQVIPETGFELGLFLELALQLSEALAAIHDRGIVHAAVRPESIFVNLATRTAKLGGLGSAFRFHQDAPPRVHPIERDVLAYEAPEQSGRVAGVIDYRSDLYALGATFYRMLCGAAPFPADDALALTYGHIAGVQVPLEERHAGTPLTLARIVDRLLAKDPAGRYQSAHGLAADLRRCCNALRDYGQISVFALGQEDLPARIEFPRKLYGRDEERGLLLAALERITRGEAAIVWIKGEAGTGKSSLVRSLERATVRAGGTLLTGKVEQGREDQPYAGLSAAVAELVHKLLTEPAPVLADFQHKLSAALGANLGLLIETLPALGQIMGPHTHRPELQVAASNAMETRARLHFAFTSLLGLLSERKRPLVLFLDDLQWASSALTQLLEAVFSEVALPHLLLIGGYRSDEADAQSPIGLMLRGLEAAGVGSETIELGNLRVGDVAKLLRDTLRADAADVEELAHVVWQKTRGNPFALRGFVEELEATGQLRPGPPSGRWTWNLAAIRQLPSSASTLGSLHRKLARLPDATRGALWVAARVGSTISVPVIAALLDQPQADTWRAFAAAISNNLVQPLETPEAAATAPGSEPSYPQLQFAHDRVQQTCAALSVADEVQALHGRIGRLLLDTLPPEQREARIFEIVDHLNSSAVPEHDSAARKRLCELNVAAAKRAHATAAYAESLRYFERALGLLALPAAWSTEHALAFEIHVGLAESAGVLRMAARARDLFELANLHVNTPAERVTLLRAWIALEFSLASNEAVLRLARNGLAELGLELPAAEEPDPIGRELEWDRVERLLREHSVDELAAWPETHGEHDQAVLELLSLATPAAYFVNKPLLDWIVVHSMALSLERGIMRSSSYSFVSYGMLRAARLHDPVNGVKYGQVALRLLERFPASDSGRIHYVFGLFLCHWQAHAEECVAHFRTALACALELGDLFHARLIPLMLPLLLTQLGKNVATVGHALEKGPEFNYRGDQRLAKAGRNVVLQAFVRSLQGAAADPTRLELEEVKEEALLQAMSVTRTLLGVCLSIKLELLVLYGRWAESVAFVERWDALILDEVGAMWFGVEYVFFSALAITALLHDAPPERRTRLAPLLELRRTRLREWARVCPMNFTNKRLLVEAELASLDGAHTRAAELYDASIAAAVDAGFAHEVAFANERAAVFYERRRRNTLARGYWEQAREAYLRWGALTKARSLPGASGQLRESTPTRDHELDLISVIKASHALSSETRLYDLVQRVLQISAENAGAERALLVVQSDDELRVAAHWPRRGPPIDPQLGVPLAAEHEASAGILRYVLRTGEAVVLDNATEEGAFTEDPTLLAVQARAILAMPLSSAKPESGVLYLENRRTPRAFMRERLALLDLLIRQASILIDNARFLERTQRLNSALAAENRERIHAESELRASERRLAGFLDGLPVGVLIMDPAAQVSFINRAARQVLGISEPVPTAPLQELYRQGATEPIATEARPSRRALRGELVWDDQLEFRRGDTAVPLTVWATPFRDPQGRVEYAIVAFQDVSDAKRAAAERARLEERVRQAQKMESIGRLASGVAHDFNNLLVPIQAYSSIAARAERHSDVVEALAHVQAAAEQAAGLTRNLLTFARKQVLNMSPLSLSDELASSARLLEGMVPANVQLVRELAPELPNILADRAQLRQVLLNLIVNACQAMPRGGRLLIATRRVELQRSLAGAHDMQEIPAGSYVVLTVSDSGEGMDEPTRARVFEPFFTTKASGHGTGLGLAMVSGIIEQHRGYIRLRSAPGEGTTFEIWFPSAPAT